MRYGAVYMLDRSTSVDDPLSEVLALLKLRNIACGAIDAGDGCIAIPANEGIKCYAVVAGEAWLAVEGVEGEVHLAEGDCFILPRGLPFRLASDLALDPVDYRTVLADRSPGHVAIFNGGGRATIVSGVFSIDGRHSDILFGVLPPIVHVRGDADRAVLRWSLDLMMRELRDPRPGSRLIMEHLAQMVLMQALRAFLAQEGNNRVGWLFALGDRQIGAAIGAMHADPAHRWTLQGLATCAGMSRTSFAVRFKDVVGSTPMHYLTHWRMLLAQDRLLHSRDPISVIAVALGYTSESSLSHAFKRTLGHSPRHYSNSGKALAAA